MTFFLALLLVSLFFPLELHSEFYKYVDKNGNSHFVDDKSKIPPEYIDNLTVYKEKYDHLPAKERSQKRQKDEMEAEKIRRQQEYLQHLELIKKRVPYTKRCIKIH